MNDLITSTKTMTSIQVAEIIGKQHKDVLRDIRDELEKLEAGGIAGERKFASSSYTSEQNKELPCYLLTREGVLQLAARYDAVTRAKLIEMAMHAEQPRPLSQLEIMHQMLGAQIEQDKQLRALAGAVEGVQAGIQDIRETVVFIPEAWRRDINTMIKRCAGKVGGTAYSDIRHESYDLLESRARCDLKRLVTNHYERRRLAGATKTELAAICSMDVIEANPRLREVYSAICKELCIKYGAGVP